MRRVFADSNYWVALFNPGDQHHAKATQVSGTVLGAGTDVVTSQMVLTEFANFLPKEAKF
jgi:predicted nucleic acid-binding protein